MSSPVFGSDDHLFFSEEVTSGLDSVQPEGQSLLGVTWGAGLEHRYHPDWGMGQGQPCPRPGLQDVRVSQPWVAGSGYFCPLHVKGKTHT